MSLIFAQTQTEVNYKIENSDDHLFRPRYKIEIREQRSLYAEVLTDAQATSINLCLEYELNISVSQINRIRQEWGKTRKPGRPRKAQATQAAESVKPKKTLVPQVGVSLFAHWLEETERIKPVFARLHEIIEEYHAGHEQKECA